MNNSLGKNYRNFYIPHLTVVLLLLQAAGFLLDIIGASFVLGYLTLNPYAILHGQIWRIFTWLIIPSNTSLSFVLVAVLFYLPIGSQMERVWGDFLYTVYILMGVAFTVIGAFLLYIYVSLNIEASTLAQQAGGLEYYSQLMSMSFTPYYIMMSIFFAYAATFPDSIVLFMFVIPIKMKWLGLLYGAYTVYTIYAGSLFERVAIIVSILNFLVFFLWSQRINISRYKPKEVKRRREFMHAVHMKKTVGSGMHRCSVCGATDTEHPEYEFRFCSKCSGMHEYCQNHLFTHTHIQ